MAMGKGQQSRIARPALQLFLASEAIGGALLIAAAVTAMVVANSPLTDWYHHLLDTPVGPVLASRLGPMTPHLWINDGLMAVFFLLVGLEIKREFAGGELSTWERRRLPIVAAVSGMAAPALIYLLVAGSDPALVRGWAIPAATDIAFAIGVLALLGRRVPLSLKLFLTAVAIADDMGAVAIIALAYTDRIDILALAAAAVLLLAMVVVARNGVTRLAPYLLLAGVLWYAVLLSGVHATIAGVLAAMAIPAGGRDSPHSPLHRLERALAPLVAFAILPMFAFANAGVSIEGLGLDAIVAPLPLAIAAGLVLGKQIGIFGATWLCVRLRAAALPAEATWLQLYGIALLCGIGFTMSLFIGGLAFAGDPLRADQARIGILLGSLISALAGFCVLRIAPPAAATASRSVRGRS